MEENFFFDLLSDVQPSALDSLGLFDVLDTSINSDDNSSNTSLNSSDESPTLPISDISFFSRTHDFPQGSEKLLPLSKPISKKKRKASAAAVKEEKKTLVTLDRDLLINMSLEEFEKKIEALTKGRSLTKEETNDIKRQRRLIKNRHSAMASRERKREEFTILKQENDVLKKEVNYLKSVIEFLTVGKGMPSLDSAPYLLIFGLLFGVLFWAQSPIPIANHANVTQATVPIKNIKFINFNVQQEVRQTPTRESSPIGRELMSYRELNNTLDDQDRKDSYDNNTLNADVPTNYIVTRSPVSTQKIQLYLEEVPTSLSVSDSDNTFSTYSQNSQSPSIVVM